MAKIFSQIDSDPETLILTPQEELTTQQAADFLNVSRPYLINLLKKGDIPYRNVGNRRKVLFKDIKKYKEKIYSERVKILNKLSDEAQELDMGY